MLGVKRNQFKIFILNFNPLIKSFINIIYFYCTFGFKIIKIIIIKL